MSKTIAIYPSDEIQKVVDYLTVSKDIDSIVENSGISTINVSSTLLLYDRDSIYLTSGLYVKIGTVNYKVSNVIKDTSFDIEAIGLTQITWSLAFEFRFGSRIEVNQLLVSASNQKSKKLVRFPLLWMVIDGSNKRGYNFASPVDFEYSLKMSMINLTEKLYTAEQRLENNFKPTIKPYVDLFLAALKSIYFTNIFNFEESEIKNYDEYFRYFYGSSDKNKKVFEPVTDAIEFEMQLQFKRQYSCNLIQNSLTQIEADLVTGNINQINIKGNIDYSFDEKGFLIEN